MTTFLISLAVFLFFVIIFLVYYILNVIMPENKRMKEGKSRITNYDKYKNEIRNF